MKSTVIINSFKKIGQIKLPANVRLEMSGPRIYVVTNIDVAHYINKDKILQDIHNILKKNHCNMWKEVDEDTTCVTPIRYGKQPSVWVDHDDVKNNIWSLHMISQELVETEKSAEDIKAFL